MSLNPTITVTPLNPNPFVHDENYKRYCSGQLFCFGAFVGDTGKYSLTECFNQDKVVFWGADNMADPPPQELPGNFFKYPLAYLTICSSALPSNQYLLIYHLYGQGNNSRVAFYAWGNLIHSEQIVGDQYVAILTDIFRSDFPLTLIMFHIGTTFLELRGIECYII